MPNKFQYLNLKVGLWPLTFALARVFLFLQLHSCFLSAIFAEL